MARVLDPDTGQFSVYISRLSGLTDLEQNVFLKIDLRPGEENGKRKSERGRARELLQASRRAATGVPDGSSEARDSS